MNTYPILETERLLLRPWKRGDAEEAFAFLSNPRVTDPADWKPHITLQQTELFIEECIADGLQWAIIFKPEQKIVGNFILCPVNRKGIAENARFLVLIHEDYWNRGIFKESLNKVMNFAFFGANAKVFLGYCCNSNQYAIRALLDCGFEKHTAISNLVPEDARAFAQFRLNRADYTVGAQPDENYDYQPEVRAKPPVSPYSRKNPIRTIDSIRYLKQSTGYLCGQAVIAMLAGVSVDEVINVMQNDKGTPTNLMSDALHYYGLQTATKTRIKYITGTPLPDCCILSLLLPGYGHWSLYYKGTFYDPEFGVSTSLPPNAKLRYYWEVLL